VPGTSPQNEHGIIIGRAIYPRCWAEARLKIARMTLTIKLDGNWSSFQLANSAPPLSVTDSAIAPSARMIRNALQCTLHIRLSTRHDCVTAPTLLYLSPDLLLPQRVCCRQECAGLAQHAKASEQAQEDTSPRKINVTSKSPVGDISVVTLIRTDTTLDHSQKAEKV
jgi:hypothetical protein